MSLDRPLDGVESQRDRLVQAQHGARATRALELRSRIGRDANLPRFAIHGPRDRRSSLLRLQGAPEQAGPLGVPGGARDPRQRPDRADHTLTVPDLTAALQRVAGMYLRYVEPPRGARVTRQLTRLFGFPERETCATGEGQGLADQLTGALDIAVAVGCKPPQRLEPHHLDRGDPALSFAAWPSAISRSDSS